MKHFLLAAGLTLVASTAAAAPQIPTRANPYPDQPVSTDGSPLPRQPARKAADDGWHALPYGPVVTGRSVGHRHH